MDRKHLKCLLWKALWVLSALSLIAAWVAGQGTVFGLSIGVWFYNALVFGILSIPIKLDCRSCETCGIGK